MDEKWAIALLHFHSKNLATHKNQEIRQLQYGLAYGSPLVWGLSDQS